MKISMFKLILVLWSIVGCTSNHKSQTKQVKIQNKPISHECVLLNDSAFKYITRYNYKHSSKDLDTALFLLKQATMCDKSYFVAYSNMANVFDLKNFSSEIETLDKMLTLNKGNWWILTRKGLAYQKANDLASAKKSIYLSRYIMPCGNQKRAGKCDCDYKLYYI